MVENTLKQAFDAETLLTGLSFVIKQKRKEKQLTQEDLSCDVGLARGYLSDVECGARNFSMKNLVKIANGLDVRPSELISLAEEYMRRRAVESHNQVQVHNHQLITASGAEAEAP